ncbi:MAG TPA: hypothetical protein VFH62_05745 [Dehalococcoidia bacterium]|jgi:hypothetical protein|nr:hypothetical protein [Dehalococcoidia bacterium]
MAFGKKKSPNEELPAEAESDAGEAIDGSLFAAPPGDEPASADLAGAFAEPEPAAADDPVEPAAEPAPPPADPLAGGDLLSMFQTTQIEADDRSALLELAGEVEIDDLLEELQTVASAMGIRAAP